MTYLLPILLALSLPGGLSLDDTVAMQNGVEFIGSVVPEQVEVGGHLAIELYFRVPEALDPDVQNFLHVESRDSSCRFVFDQTPDEPEDGLLVHRVEVDVPATDECHPQQLAIYTGLYNRVTQERFEVYQPTVDDRLFAGYVDLVSSTPSDGERVNSSSDLRFARRLDIARPFRFWALGLVVSLIVLVLLRRLSRQRFGAVPPQQHSGTPTLDSRRAVRLSVLPAIALLLTSIVVSLDFVKDDAYISFRYAHNLVIGDGLVFNPGERVEGFTNFLWVLVVAPFEALGWDLFQVLEVFGSVLAIALVVQMTALAMHFHGSWRSLCHLWGAIWLASSSALGLWATSGMEQPLAMLLPLTSAYLLWKVWDEDAPGRSGLLSGVLMGLGCMTRPEIHLIGFFLGLPLLFRAFSRRRLDRVSITWFVGLLAVTVPFHLFRLIYFGSLFPNTFYVKTGGSTLVMINGLRTLYDMLAFNGLGALLLLAPLAFLNRAHRTEKLVMLAISLSFMFYIVWVGQDEMRWYRLYLPPLPFLVLLAAMGLRNLLWTLGRLLPSESIRKRAAPIALAMGWAVVILAASLNFGFTYRSMSGFNGRGDLAGTFHPDMGKFLTRHERPGGLVAFQDMGSTPYHAPDIEFLDFIGLVDTTVAEARHSYGLNAYIATEARRSETQFDAEMREYFYDRNPEWAILTSYIPGFEAELVSRRFALDPVAESLGRAVSQNRYQFDIYDDTFRERYVHVRTWPRSSTYYLSLFRRRDLWEQVPGEVVLDAPPDDLGGVRASFEGGLELLGSEMEHEVRERHEVFITTWWQTPGPMEPDIWFFVHVESESHRTPVDHLPGDFMFPADRWRAGDIIEDRYLFQVPVDMREGTYQVYMGVYRRSTGERLRILEGSDDGSGRLHIGTLNVLPLRPVIDQLIPPTDIEAQRIRGERIIDSGR